MKLNVAMRKYRLHSAATPEKLETRFSGMNGKTLYYGHRVLVAGHFWTGSGKPCWFGAV